LDEDVSQTLRVLRGHLNELVPAADTAEVDRQVAGLLRESDDERLFGQLTTLYGAVPGLEAWVSSVLADPLHRPPAAQDRAVRGVDRPPGDGEPVDADRFGCPERDYIWYRLSVAMPVPRCPTHDRVLIRED
jgi:hypothetical protein